MRVGLTAALAVVLGRGAPDFAAAFWLCLAIIGSDLLDGQAARRLAAGSTWGARFDVAADGLYALVAAFMLGRLGLVPTWYPAVVTVKLAEFLSTSRLLSPPGSPTTLVFDPLGRLAAAGFMTVPPAVLAEYLLTGRSGGGLPAAVTALALGAAAVRIARVLGHRRPARQAAPSPQAAKPNRSFNARSSSSSRCSL